VLRRARAPRALRWGWRVIRWWRLWSLWRRAAPALAAIGYPFDRAGGSARGLPSRSIAT
jgi:hypothetical protein